MNERDIEIDRWNKRLRNLGDKQFANERELRRHERLQDEVDYVHRQGDRLFRELGGAWYQDPEMARFLDEQRDGFRRRQFQVMDGLAEERARMEREKRMLVENESEYYAARRKLALGGEQG
ncbi:DUF3958 family protein [Listeria newyorkensis]|uniref:DUF3958 family protein n=1 Tax=Listeria newyorkensis TaxID=1497681 RepID=A0A841YV08_9LIST|nr:DUF3958 family protein [Listeria newyorkensis]MBC1457118.1 DUF3958 family protein [Listeria newyorkensis]